MNAGGGGDYELVQVTRGAWSVRSRRDQETFHPVIGPQAEAEALYVRQLDLPGRLAAAAGEFVVWDVGLGAAANVLTVLRAVAGLPARLRVESFDHTLDPLRFARQHPDRLPYLAGFEGPVDELLAGGAASFRHGRCQVDWRVQEADFPGLLASPAARSLPVPQAILFDAYSPARNPAMWTLPLFRDLWGCLDPARPCSLATYSRSTLLRVTLLLAGFRVGSGDATGEKEETTLAANTPDLIARPLTRAWLARAGRSTSAEPLAGPVYRQAPLEPASREALERHPQFREEPAGIPGGKH